MFAKFYLGKTNNEKLLQTCVKWHNVWSRWFRLSCGIRQGGVLSSYLFAIYTVHRQFGRNGSGV